MRRKRVFHHETVIWQCETCHRGAGAVSRRDIAALSFAEIRDLPPAVLVRKRQPNSRTRAYRALLQSKEWRELRARVFARAQGYCEVDGCRSRATDLAHLHYEKPLGEETEADVQAQCSFHNQQERERRITKAVLG